MSFEYQPASAGVDQGGKSGGDAFGEAGSCAEAAGGGGFGAGGGLTSGWGAFSSGIGMGFGDNAGAAAAVGMSGGDVTDNTSVGNIVIGL